ncbi:hypothetical protein CLF_111627 [Clonorchis sinensis]|uniref:Uncharacterized protein n=1 Tax=Clonorchis sinensis TaxID=79923 RepID=G7YV54_CLOSI|nr:hypothetical protein CLF_111627 [Clonorchis sinensis]
MSWNELLAFRRLTQRPTLYRRIALWRRRGCATEALEERLERGFCSALVQPTQKVWPSMHANATDRDSGLQLLLNHCRPLDYQRQQFSGGGKPCGDTASKPMPQTRQYRTGKSFILIVGHAGRGSLGSPHNTKEKGLPSTKPHKIRRIGNQLTDSRVQSSEETNLMGAPPKGILFGATTQSKRLHRDTLSIRAQQNAQETNQTYVCTKSVNRNKPSRPKSDTERAAVSSI